MAGLLPAIEGPEFGSWRDKIAGFGLRQPQTMLIEGGAETQRLELGLYRALAANCPAALAAAAQGQPARPCLDCRVCKQIAANEYADLFIYDGRISNKEDADNPGPIRALNMENVRALKVRMTAEPKGNGKRVVIFQGMLLNTRDSAMNGLLKNLEDPCGHTLFTLLAPQRAQILPTLVSRSHVTTLPWPEDPPTSPELLEWTTALAAFLDSGKGFLEKAGSKKALTPTLAQLLVLSCQHVLALAPAKKDRFENDLARAIAPLANRPADFALFLRWLSEAQEMLLAGVNPSRVLEALSVKLYVLLRQGRQRPA